MRLQGPKDYFKPHSSNVICDRCGFKAKSDELMREWNGLMVHPRCHEPRNQQDLLRGVPDNLPRPYYRPEPPDDFIDNPKRPISLITLSDIPVYFVDDNGIVMTDDNGEILTP